MAQANETTVCDLAEVVIKKIDANRLAQTSEHMGSHHGSGVITFADQVQIMDKSGAAGEILDGNQLQPDSQASQDFLDSQVANPDTCLVLLLLRGQQHTDSHPRSTSMLTQVSANVSWISTGGSLSSNWAGKRDGGGKGSCNSADTTVVQT